MKQKYYRDLISQPPVFVSEGVRLSSSQQNVGGNDLYHFWAWPIKSPTESSTLSLSHVLTRFGQFCIPCIEGSKSFYQFKSLIDYGLENIFLPIQTQNYKHKLLLYKAIEISEFIDYERKYLLDKYKQKKNIALINEAFSLYKAILDKNVISTEPENIGQTLQFTSKPLFSISNQYYFL